VELLLVGSGAGEKRNESSKEDLPYREAKELISG